MRAAHVDSRAPPASSLPKVAGTSAPDASNPPVCILWDFENCRVPSDYSAHAAAEALLTAARLATLPNNAQPGGQLVRFQVYGDWSLVDRRTANGLRVAGATLVHTPHVEGLSNTADLALITDALASTNLLDRSQPMRVFCLMGDRDYGPMLRMLRNWHHEVVLVNPHPTTAKLAPSLTESADAILSWRHDILDIRFNYTPAWREVATVPLTPAQKRATSHLRSPARAFAPLVDTLLTFLHNRVVAPTKKAFIKQLLEAYPDAYTRAGVTTADDYIALAVASEVLWPPSAVMDTVRLDRHYFAHLIKLHLSAFPFPAAAAANIVDPSLRGRYRLEGSFLSGRQVGGPVIPLRREQRFALRRLSLSPLATYLPLIETLLYTLRFSGPGKGVNELHDMLTREFGVDVFGQLGMSNWPIYLQSAMDAGLVRLTNRLGVEVIQLPPDWFPILLHLQAIVASTDRSNSTRPQETKMREARTPVQSTPRPAASTSAPPISESRPSLEALYAPARTDGLITAPPFTELANLMRTLATVNMETAMTHPVSAGLLVKEEGWDQKARLIKFDIARSAQGLGLATMQSDDLNSLQAAPRFYVPLYHVMELQQPSSLVAADWLQRRWKEDTGTQTWHQWFDEQTRVSRRIASPLYAFVPLLDILLSRGANESEELSLVALKQAVLKLAPHAVADAQVPGWDEYVSMAKDAGIICIDFSTILPTASLSPAWMAALFHLELIQRHAVAPPPRPLPPKLPTPAPVLSVVPELDPQPAVKSKVTPTPARLFEREMPRRRPPSSGGKAGTASSQQTRRMRFLPRITPAQMQAAQLTPSPLEAFGPLANVLLQIEFSKLPAPNAVELARMIMASNPDTLDAAGVDGWDSYLSLAEAAGIVQVSSSRESDGLITLEPDFYIRLAEFQSSSGIPVEPFELEGLLEVQRVKQWDEPLSRPAQASFTDEAGGLAEYKLPEEISSPSYGVTDVIWDDQKDAFAPAAQIRQEPSSTQITARRREAVKDIDHPLEVFAPLIETLLKSGGAMASSAEAGQLFASRFPGVFKLAGTLSWKLYLKRATEAGILDDIPEEGIVELQPDFWVTILDLHLSLKGKLPPRPLSEFKSDLDVSPVQARLYEVVQASGSAIALFAPLVQALLGSREVDGASSASRLHVRTILSIELDGGYSHLGVRDFDEYMGLAEAAGLALSDSVGTTRFALDARWYARLLQLQRAAFSTLQEATEGLHRPPAAFNFMDAPNQPQLASSALSPPNQRLHNQFSTEDADSQPVTVRVPSALAGIHTNPLYTFMPLLDMMLAHASARSGHPMIPRTWLASALDANFDSLFSHIGVRGFDDYIQLAKDADLLAPSPDGYSVTPSPFWLLNLALMHLSYLKRPNHPSPADFDESCAEAHPPADQPDAPYVYQGTLEPLSSEEREQLLSTVKANGTVIRTFASQVDEHLGLCKKMFDPFDPLDRVAEKLGLFQRDEDEPWSWLSLLANIELAIHPHKPQEVEAEQARGMLFAPADVVDRLLIARKASILDDLATIDSDRLATAFDLGRQETFDLVSQLQDVGLVTAATKRPSRVLFPRTFGAPRTPMCDNIRLGPDWWQRFVRLHAAFCQPGSYNDSAQS